MKDRCRVCMAMAGPFINIFDERPTWDTCVGDMIAQCTGYVVERGDSLSEKICPFCLEDAVSAFSLKKTCEQSHQVDWEQLLDSQVRFETKPSRGGTMKRPYQCAECSRSFAYSKSLRNHVCHQCDDCAKSFKSVSRLILHSRTQHKGERPYQCTECSKTFKQKSHLNAHKHTHTREQFYQSTGRTKSFQQQLTHHTEHPPRNPREQPLKCAHCDKFILGKKTLREHTLTHAEELPYQQAPCSKSFEDQSSLQVHIPCPAVAHQCVECSKAFISKACLERHIQLEHYDEHIIGI
ncbi:zinc finger protein 22-like [Drosophila guanche]|uniref:zinc finger protein 22-like n=1 Tax=Drosophila guanche TaxID=7266 RepID=UPI00147199C4|nr:zinc finger protein 22-like [Drosophila guanche]